MPGPRQIERDIDRRIDEAALMRLMGRSSSKAQHKIEKADRFLSHAQTQADSREEIAKDLRKCKNALDAAAENANSDAVISELNNLSDGVGRLLHKYS